MDILSKMPSAKEFYQTYWNKKPFVVKKYIDEGFLAEVLDENELAYLATCEEVESKLIYKNPAEDKSKRWTVEFGPFDEQKVSSLPESDWTILVQNVESYHYGTSKLFDYFNFSPQWLRDDIMVSFSPKGGTVGPHTDSYHVFLVQGKGSRHWEVATSPCNDHAFEEDTPLKILKKSISGDNVTVSSGDVLYIPPHVAHEGVSLEESLTFSIGFLGPNKEEMLSSYADYLMQNREDVRYQGEGLNESDSGFSISNSSVKQFKESMLKLMESDHFENWLVQYFSNGVAPVADDQEEPKSFAGFEKELSVEERIYEIYPIKLSVIKKSDNVYAVGCSGYFLEVNKTELDLLSMLSKEKSLKCHQIKNSSESILNLFYNLYLEEMIGFDN